MVVHTQKIAAKKGLNSFTYDYLLAKEDAEKWNKKDKKIKIIASENKKFYVPIGKYKGVLSKDKATENSSFEISAPKK